MVPVAAERRPKRRSAADDAGLLQQLLPGGVILVEFRNDPEWCHDRLLLYAGFPTEWLILTLMTTAT